MALALRGVKSGHLGTMDDHFSFLTKSAAPAGWLDAALLTAAGLPGYLERRLDAAFDAVVAEG